MSRINPVPNIDTYFLKIHSNTVLPLYLGLPKGLFLVGLPVNILKAILPSSIHIEVTMIKEKTWKLGGMQDFILDVGGLGSLNLKGQIIVSYLFLNISNNEVL